MDRNNGNLTSHEHSSKNEANVPVGSSPRFPLAWPFGAFRDSHLNFSRFMLEHEARRYCLFVRHKSKACEKLVELEEKADSTIEQAWERYAHGDRNAFIKTHQELMELQQETDNVRMDVVQEGEQNWAGSQDLSRRPVDGWPTLQRDNADDWSWPWGSRLPRLFDEEEKRQSLENIMDTVEDKMFGRFLREFWDDWGIDPSARRWDRSSDNEHGNGESASNGPRVWSWTFRWPPREGNTPENNAPEHSMLPRLLFSDGTGSTLLEELWRNSLAYSPLVLESNTRLQRSGISWRDAYEDLLRAERGSPLIPKESIGESRSLPYDRWLTRILRDRHVTLGMQLGGGQYPKRVPWSTETGREEDTREEPSYEYSHDHEDQHDDHPTPQTNQKQSESDMPSTELDAYERLLDSASAPGHTENELRPSVLSMLTTTERTILPDGTVQTKTVLRKRFSDGREERSESFHTQNRDGSETTAPQYDWPSDPAQQEPTNAKGARNKKSGWFWSN